MADEPRQNSREVFAPDKYVKMFLVVIEYAIVVSLMIISSFVLVRTLIDFLRHAVSSSEVVSGIDGILVVIIVLDIAQTVYGHLRTSDFPVRPFLVIGILAGIRDILSASARLTLNVHLTQRAFDNTLVSLGVGVGVVVVLLAGLLLLRWSGHQEAVLDA